MYRLDEKSYPNFAKLIDQVLALWPEHARYLEKTISSRDIDLMRFSERLSAMIIRLASTIDGGLTALANDYRFLCDQIVLPEEMHFRRTGRYRLDKFEDALRLVYKNSEFMTRYMNGLLVSDVLWVNHCRGLQHYADVFLKGLKPGAELLEIGPGHGLLLNLASESSSVESLAAWDVSQASLDMSRHALEVLGAERPVKFEPRDIFDPEVMDAKNANKFDAVVFSEVIEHLEHPELAVRVLLHVCKPGGRVWINAPANSPMPDHLYLITDPAQLEEVVHNAGFNIVDTANFPMTGATLERAVKQKLTITCIVVAERPAA